MKQVSSNPLPPPGDAFGTLVRCPWAEKCPVMHFFLVVSLSGFPTNCKIPNMPGVHSSPGDSTSCGSSIKPEPRERRHKGIPPSLKEKQQNQELSQVKQFPKPSNLGITLKQNNPNTSCRQQTRSCFLKVSGHKLGYLL